MFTRTLHWSLSWGRPIQSIPPYPVSLISILILSTHLRLGLPSGFYAFTVVNYWWWFCSLVITPCCVGSVATFRSLHTASIFKVEVFRFSGSVYIKHSVLANRGERVNRVDASSGTSRPSLPPKRRQHRPHSQCITNQEQNWRAEFSKKIGHKEKNSEWDFHHPGITNSQLRAFHGYVKTHLM
jgi:hypothetical protein